MTQSNTSSSSGLLGTIDPSLASNITAAENYLPLAKIYIGAITVMLVVITIGTVIIAIHTKKGGSAP